MAAQSPPGRGGSSSPSDPELSGDGRLAKVIATVATSYSDRDEESIEDDIIYLARVGERWLVAKPSATLYRAVGVADVPPSVLSPPR